MEFGCLGKYDEQRQDVLVHLHKQLASRDGKQHRAIWCHLHKSCWERRDKLLLLRFVGFVHGYQVVVLVGGIWNWQIGISNLLLTKFHIIDTTYIFINKTLSLKNNLCFLSELLRVSKIFFLLSQQLFCLLIQDFCLWHLRDQSCVKWVKALYLIFLHDKQDIILSYFV